MIKEAGMEKYETPGTLTIMIIYLILFVLGYILLFVHLGSKWPIG
jgi:hypothetical protein